MGLAKQITSLALEENDKEEKIHHMELRASQRKKQRKHKKRFKT